MMFRKIKGIRARKKYLNYINKVMSENEKFLYENSRMAYDQIIEIANDVIDYLGIFINHNEGASAYTKNALSYLINHILMPVSGSIYINALSGNLLVCFVELRLVLESLAKCYFADTEFSELDFFQDRLHSLEKSMKKPRRTITDLMQEFDELFVPNGNRIAENLWRELSNEWVHVGGVMNGIVNQIIEKDDVPPWGLVLPLNYTMDDLDKINELGDCILKTRHLLMLVLEKIE